MNLEKQLCWDRGFILKKSSKKKKKEIFMAQARVAVMAGAQWKWCCFLQVRDKLCHNHKFLPTQMVGKHCFRSDDFGKGFPISMMLSLRIPMLHFLPLPHRSLKVKYLEGIFSLILFLIMFLCMTIPLIFLYHILPLIKKF